MTQVFKIVRVDDDGQLVSAYCPSAIALNYEPGKLVKPKVGYIMAFISKRHATNFTLFQLSGGKQLWTAEANIVLAKDRLPALWNIFPGNDDDKDRDVIEEYVRAYWANQIVPANTVYTPYGTIFCTELTLLRRL